MRIVPRVWRVLLGEVVGERASRPAERYALDDEADERVEDLARWPPGTRSRATWMPTSLRLCGWATKDKTVSSTMSVT